MSAETAPRPSPAPQAARVAAQARFEAGILLRNGEQVLVALVLPALALVALVAAPYPQLTDPRIAVVAPGVLALAIVSTAFTGQAIQTAFDRRYGVLRMLATTPVGTDGHLLGKALAITVMALLQVVLLGVLALALGWRPDPVGLLGVPVSTLLGVWVFVALALLLAGSLRAEACSPWPTSCGCSSPVPAASFSPTTPSGRPGPSSAGSRRARSVTPSASPSPRVTSPSSPGSCSSGGVSCSASASCAPSAGATDGTR